MKRYLVLNARKERDKNIVSLVYSNDLCDIKIITFPYTKDVKELITDNYTEYISNVAAEHYEYENATYYIYEILSMRISRSNHPSEMITMKIGRLVDVAHIIGTKKKIKENPMINILMKEIIDCDGSASKMMAESLCRKYNNITDSEKMNTYKSMLEYFINTDNQTALEVMVRNNVMINEIFISTKHPKIKQMILGLKEDEITIKMKNKLESKGYTVLSPDGKVTPKESDFIISGNINFDSSISIRMTKDQKDTMKQLLTQMKLTNPKNSFEITKLQEEK